VRAAIYVRISKDRTGAGLGVQRQEEDCRALCERRGWQVIRVYVDNDVSAYSGKPRPAWRELLADLAAGRMDAVVCWHVDRLTRSPRELEDVIDLHDSHGVALATVTGEIDLSTPTGRMVARTLGAAARHESEHKAERQRRERLQKAQAGQPSTGTRGYGYTLGNTTIIETEAEVVREAATRVLAGESLRSVARDLNERAIPSATGKQWSVPALRAILVSGRISGRREYHGQIVADPSWPAIITVAQSDELRALFLGRPGTSRDRARTYLLSGILRCGTCGHSMCGRPHTAGRRYICPRQPGNIACGTIAVMADAAEVEVRDRVLTALDNPDFLARLLAAETGDSNEGGDSTDVSARLREIDSQRNDLAAMWAAKEIDRKEWLAARAELRDEADALTATLARSQHGRALAEFAAMEGHLWQRWEQLPPGAQRALITAIVDHIDVHPARSRHWNPDRIADPIWRA
jgi:DNA invertase Pin-like site-specific DNA recombinase